MHYLAILLTWNTPGMLVTFNFFALEFLTSDKSLLFML